LENLTLDQTNVPTNSGWGGITFYDCFGCWVHGVREIDANLNHVWLFQSSQATIESSYFYGTHSGGGIESYGIESYLASNNLIQNNIFQQISGPFMGGPTEGTVFAYNYAVNDPSGAATIMSAEVWATHDVDQFSLFEGNIGPQGRADSTFANGDFNTFFRNRFFGMDYGRFDQEDGLHLPDWVGILESLLQSGWKCAGHARLSQYLRNVPERVRDELYECGYQHLRLWLPWRWASIMCQSYVLPA
jgi:hypothetical protein